MVTGVLGGTKLEIRILGSGVALLVASAGPTLAGKQVSQRVSDRKSRVRLAASAVEHDDPLIKLQPGQTVAVQDSDCVLRYFVVVEEKGRTGGKLRVRLIEKEESPVVHHRHITPPPGKSKGVRRKSHHPKPGHIKFEEAVPDGYYPSR